MRTEASNPDTSPAPAPRRSGGLPIHVLLVDDHPAVRHAIHQLIADQPDLVTIAETGAASDATSELARWADVAVIDFHLGDRDGLWLTQQVKQRRSPPAVLIYSAFADPALAAASIVAGADGLLSKTALAEELCIAIRRLCHGRPYFPAVGESVTAALRSRLRPRDQAIFSMLVHGVAPAEIGARLGIGVAELEARRKLIVRTIAPRAAGRGVPERARAPLDYERPRRRWSHPAAP
jgi:DNA-binding NarL/FixJ family response regulator